MVYPGNFGRIVASGTLYGTETFSFGLSAAPNFSGPWSIDPETIVEDVALAIAEFFGSVSIDNSAALNLVKFNTIGPDGRYVDQSETVQYEIDPPVPGIANTNPAAQVAIAISLMTARVRGRAHTGRFYLPVPTAPVANDGLISEANALEFGTAASRMLTDLNGILGSAGRISVVSDVGTGRFQPVTHVRVGRVYDTIRSRRRSLAENYVESPPLG